jgi:hypothetical protein
MMAQLAGEDGEIQAGIYGQAPNQMSVTEYNRQLSMYETTERYFASKVDFGTVPALNVDTGAPVTMPTQTIETRLGGLMQGIQSGQYPREQATALYNDIKAKLVDKGADPKDVDRIWINLNRAHPLYKPMLEVTLPRLGDVKLPTTEEALSEAEEDIAKVKELIGLEIRIK